MQYFLSKDFFTRLGVLFGLSLSLSLVVGSISLISTSQLVSAYETLNKSRQNLEELESFLGIMTDAETGVRGYALSLNPEYLETFNTAKNRVGPALSYLETGLTVETQKQSFSRLKILAYERIQSLEDSRLLIQQGNAAEIQRRIKAKVGKNIQDKLRAEVRSIRENELSILSAREEKTRFFSQISFLSVLAAISCNLLILTWAYQSVKREIEAHQKTQEELRKVHETEHLNYLLSLETASSYVSNKAERQDILQKLDNMVGD